jgi:F420-dependent oxidoreductase-like protein
MTQIGLMLEGQDGLTWDRWKRILQAAEDLNYQCVFRSDHFTNAAGEDKESLELWLSLTYAASHTQRIEFGPLVTPVTFRHPAMTARMGAQVDDLSNGRLVLGLGAGWQDREHRKFGIPFYDFPTRYKMFAEALELTHRLYHTEGPAYYEGKHFSLDEAELLPRPQRPNGPPILIGGNGPTRTLPLAAKYADEWNAVFLTPDLYVERAALLDKLLTEAGRQPGDVKRSIMTQVIYGRDEAELQSKLQAHNNASVESLIQQGYIVGTPNAIVEQLGQWAERGVQRFMLQWLALDDLDGLESMAATVVSQVHS